MRILRWNGFSYLTSPFFLQCYKPQYTSFKIVFDTYLIKEPYITSFIDLH